MAVNLGFSATQGFPYGFHRAELHLGTRIYAAITSVQADQPTEDAPVKGTQPGPINSTEGSMDLGDGTVTFSDEADRMKFLQDLGNGYRSKRWNLMWILRAEGRPDVKLECFGCRVKGNPFDHSEGADALGGDVQFSFLSHKINGLDPHKANAGAGTVAI